jgi:TonB family protein
VLIVATAALWPALSYWDGAGDQQASEAPEAASLAAESQERLPRSTDVGWQQPSTVQGETSDWTYVVDALNGETSDWTEVIDGVGLQAPAPARIKKVEPTYPKAAQDARVEGVVAVTYQLDAGGRPINLRVTQSVPMLDQAVLSALRQWEYTPPRFGAAPRTFHYHVEFVLNRVRP